MAMPDPHDQAEELLPWYATGQLEGADRARVEAHLASCARCQRRLGLERVLLDQVRALAPEVEGGWARLRARIEARPTSRSRIAEAGATCGISCVDPRSRPLPARRSPFLRSPPGPP